ncbi:hypothetical protein C8Q79DRAFT_887671, partial [Trametes meyenii]
LGSELFFPDHLRLGPSNWLEFKLAVETLFRVKNLPLAHLKHVECPRSLSADKDARERWAVEDQLCRAILLLNVRSSFLPFAELEHEQWGAAEVWDMLVRRDLQLRNDALDKWRWLMGMYVRLLGAACVVLVALVVHLWVMY